MILEPQFEPPVPLSLPCTPGLPLRLVGKLALRPDLQMTSKYGPQ
jgi:hypothetical protein